MISSSLKFQPSWTIRPLSQTRRHYHDVNVCCSARLSPNSDRNCCDGARCAVGSFHTFQGSREVSRCGASNQDIFITNIIRQTQVHSDRTPSPTCAIGEWMLRETRYQPILAQGSRCCLATVPRMTPLSNQRRTAVLGDRQQAQPRIYRPSNMQGTFYKGQRPPPPHIVSRTHCTFVQSRRK